MRALTMLSQLTGKLKFSARVVATPFAQQVLAGSICIFSTTRSQGKGGRIAYCQSQGDIKGCRKYQSTEMIAGGCVTPGSCAL